MGFHLAHTAEGAGREDTYFGAVVASAVVCSVCGQIIGRYDGEVPPGVIPRVQVADDRPSFRTTLL